MKSNINNQLLEIGLAAIMNVNNINPKNYKTEEIVKSANDQFNKSFETISHILKETPDDALILEVYGAIFLNMIKNKKHLNYKKVG